MLSRVQLGREDPRIKPTYRFPSSVLGEKASTNNFCNGMFSAVNWEQVARMQQISAARNARTSLGPVAWQNSTTGQPQYLWQTFCPYLNRTAWGIAAVVAKSLGRQLGPPGQLLFLLSEWTGHMFNSMLMIRTLQWENGNFRSLNHVECNLRCLHQILKLVQ